MAQDQQIDLPHKQQTYDGFIQLTKWGIGLCVVTLVLLAIVLL
ncbi:MAG: aa3-type cytochrome c oxidase subunit IV [Alphaproteobacteria bacterium]|nr:aa3-type cytochrome c oxidase subunit IV [Alphaproteobacteria bacterium]